MRSLWPAVNRTCSLDSASGRFRPNHALSGECSDSDAAKGRSPQTGLGETTAVLLARISARVPVDGPCLPRMPISHLAVSGQRLRQGGWRPESLRHENS